MTGYSVSWTFKDDSTVSDNSRNRRNMQSKVFAQHQNISTGFGITFTPPTIELSAYDWMFGWIWLTYDSVISSHSDANQIISKMDGKDITTGLTDWYLPWFEELLRCHDSIWGMTQEGGYDNSKVNLLNYSYRVMHKLTRFAQIA